MGTTHQRMETQSFLLPPLYRTGYSSPGQQKWEGVEGPVKSSKWKDKRGLGEILFAGGTLTQDSCNSL